MPKLFYQPVRPFVVNQPFGANTVCVNVATGKKVISCDGLNPPPGYNSVYTQFKMKGHNGLDLGASRWTPVYASRGGTVIEVETEISRGLGVGIRHDLGADGMWKTRYWHLIGSIVELGQNVEAGQLIGYADSTGYSTGDHLHFEVKRLNQDGSNRYQENGYFGAEDPSPLLLPMYARDATTLRSILEKLLAAAEALLDKL